MKNKIKYKVMNWELFDKIYVDVNNGCSKKEMIERYGVDVIKEYEEWGDENDVFEGDWF